MQSHNAVSVDSPTPDNGTPVDVPGSDLDEIPTDEQLFALFDFAPMVGERGSDVVERVLLKLARGNRRAYRAELNRLAAKFLATADC
jgi:hypothetical protein